MNEDEVISTKDSKKLDLYEKGKLYKFDGHEMVELPLNEDVVKVPITPEALALVSAARNRIHDELKRRSSDGRARRPELDVVASVLLTQGASGKIDGLADEVIQFYRKIFS